MLEERIMYLSMVGMLKGGLFGGVFVVLFLIDFGIDDYSLGVFVWLDFVFGLV